MGYDTSLFVVDVHKELICCICKEVLQEPLYSVSCEHTFCKSCINNWLARKKCCPVDRQPLTPAKLKPVQRLVKNILFELPTKCAYSSFGCTKIVSLGYSEEHRKRCEHNPKFPVECPRGCGQVLPKEHMKDHFCAKDLTECVRTVEQMLEEMDAEVIEIKNCKTLINEQLAKRGKCSRELKTEVTRRLRRIQAFYHEGKSSFLILLAQARLQKVEGGNSAVYSRDKPIDLKDLQCYMSTIAGISMKLKGMFPKK